MSLFIKTPVVTGITRSLYRDALVAPNNGTRFLFDSLNSFGWDTPEVIPVAGKALTDLSANAHPCQFQGTGFGDSSATQGFITGEDASSRLEIGTAGDINLRADGVTGFVGSFWIKIPEVKPVANRVVAGNFLSALSDPLNRQWVVYIRGGNIYAQITTDEGTLSTLAGYGAHVGNIIQFSFCWKHNDTGGSDLKLFINKNEVASVSDTSSQNLVNQPSSITGLGQVGTVTASGITHYRAMLEAFAASTDSSNRDPLDIIALDYEINKNRFS